MHYSHILSIHINIHYSTATLPNTTCYTATHTHAYTLVLYQTLTPFLALIDSRPPLSRIRRIASKDREEAALCSGVSPPYYDILYIQIAYDNTFILVYTYTINSSLLIYTTTFTHVHIYTCITYLYLKYN